MRRRVLLAVLIASLAVTTEDPARGGSAIGAPLVMSANLIELRGGKPVTAAVDPRTLPSLGNQLNCLTAFPVNNSNPVQGFTAQLAF